MPPSPFTVVVIQHNAHYNAYNIMSNPRPSLRHSANVHLSRPCLRYIIIGTTGIKDEGGSGCSDYNIMYLGIIIVYNYCGTASRTHRKIVDPFLLCVYVYVYRRLILLHNQRGYSQDLGSYGN